MVGELFGPEAVPIGAWIGGKLGGMIGRAAGIALAQAMENANKDADKLKEAAADKPCLQCGEVDCFAPPKGADVGEFARQLQEQQDTINGMKPQDLLDNMRKYDEIGRGAGDAAARQQARSSWISNRTSELTKQYLTTMDPEQAATQAAADSAKEASMLDATHDLDLVAGGGGNLTDQLGGRSINRSIGSQWKGRRVAELKKHAEDAKKQGKKMNVKLKICPPAGGEDADPPTAPPSPPRDGPGAGSETMS